MLSNVALHAPPVKGTRVDKTKDGRLEIKRNQKTEGGTCCILRRCVVLRADHVRDHRPDIWSSREKGGRSSCGTVWELNPLTPEDKCHCARTALSPHPHKKITWPYTSNSLLESTSQPGRKTRTPSRAHLWACMSSLGFNENLDLTTPGPLIAPEYASLRRVQVRGYHVRAAGHYTEGITSCHGAPIAHTWGWSEECMPALSRAASKE